MITDKREQYMDSTGQWYSRFDNGQYSFWRREVDGELFTPANTLKKIFPNVTIEDLYCNTEIECVKGIHNTRFKLTENLYGTRAVKRLQVKYVVANLDPDNVLQQMTIRNDIPETVPSN